MPPINHLLFVPASSSSSFLNRSVPPFIQPSLPKHHVTPPNLTVVKAVASKPPKLSKVEGIKTDSNQLRFPLNDELYNEKTFISENAVQVMKFHGSYQQDNRDLRSAGSGKHYQFMLRLKMPAGDFPASLYKVIDDIATTHGNNTLRATTRCAWQIHGILKTDLKTVFGAIMNAGGSCVGACGDISRNVMCTPAPFTNKLYSHARWVSRMVGELFAPQTNAFSEIWLDGEKAATLEYWKHDLNMDKVQEALRFDNGNGVVFKDKVEPLYGETYLPRKFKVGVTVPGDNSIDAYTQDICVVCVPDAQGIVVGYNLIVGGGMGRTHRKESTFARVGDHLGYVSSDKLWEALKAILATQRDHGNRSVRANARMKYLVDKLGIDGFRILVESYFGDSFEPFRELKPWKYEDWLGWHEQGDGNLFLGLFVAHGRIKDEGDFKLRTALRRITDAYEFDMVVTPNQNVILKNITPNQKDGIEAIIREHGVSLATDYDMNQRISMACPALPLCGLAITEAERVMPSVVDRVSALCRKMDISQPITMRMTGCPNGCARPYMAELGFVGSGLKTYQIWLGGSPNQTRLAWPHLEKAKDERLEEQLTPILEMYKRRRQEGEAFGDFCARMGKSEIMSFTEKYVSEPVSTSASSTSTVTESRAATSKPLVTVVDSSEKLSLSDKNASKLVGTTAASTSTVSESNVVESKPAVTVVRGPPKVTVVETPPKSSTVEMTVSTESSAPAAATESGSGSTVGDSSKESDAKPSNAKRAKARPRLTVSDDIMERLKNIAALRDMSASKVADEIIRAYLTGVEDEDVVGDEIDM